MVTGIYVVEWSKDWSEVVNIYKWDVWAKTPVRDRSFHAEAIEARDELDAFMQIMNKEQTQ